MLRNFPEIQNNVMDYEKLEQIATFQNKLAFPVVAALVEAPAPTGSTHISTTTTPHQLTISFNGTYKSCDILEGDIFYDEDVELDVVYTSSANYFYSPPRRIKEHLVANFNVVMYNRFNGTMNSYTVNNSFFVGTILLRNEKTDASITVTSASNSWIVPAASSIFVTQD